MPRARWRRGRRRAPYSKPETVPAVWTLLCPDAGAELDGRPGPDVVLAGPGDLNLDGVATGAVYVAPGQCVRAKDRGEDIPPLEVGLYLSPGCMLGEQLVDGATVYGPAWGEDFGWTVRSGDIDGDGAPDLLVRSIASRVVRENGAGPTPS